MSDLKLIEAIHLITYKLQTTRDLVIKTQLEAEAWTLCAFANEEEIQEINQLIKEIQAERAQNGSK